jgi:hypothetical protein
VDWFDVRQDRDDWLDLVNIITNVRVRYVASSFISKKDCAPLNYLVLDDHCFKKLRDEMN